MDKLSEQGLSAPPASAIARVSMEDALSNNWLEVWYQPKIDLRRKCLAGAEALVRMHHPQAGALWPPDYLGALDEEGLLKVSEYVLVTALRQLDSVCGGGLWAAPLNQCASRPSSEDAGESDRCGASAAVREMARADIGGDRRPDRA